MNAKEMFKKLGYELVEENEIFLNYNSEACMQHNGYVITFYKTGFFEAKESLDDSINEYSKCWIPARLTVKEFKAIQQQIKELGWEEVSNE